ncbi:hypothetical protein D9C73_001722 [Collichthys lucidus]|uniref:Uncharacterized protein n=1 Tax=Collichthys lucidus TaxID=240159 RepID=A0A4U5U281_COLLU|nr:hypothetical protein D9C73_001722 [Collichthys lucidus]
MNRAGEGKRQFIFRKAKTDWQVGRIKPGANSNYDTIDNSLVVWLRGSAAVGGGGVPVPECRRLPILTGANTKRLFVVTTPRGGKETMQEIAITVNIGVFGFVESETFPLSGREEKDLISAWTDGRSGDVHTKEHHVGGPEVAVAVITEVESGSIIESIIMMEHRKWRRQRALHALIDLIKWTFFSFGCPDAQSGGVQTNIELSHTEHVGFGYLYFTERSTFQVPLRASQPTLTRSVPLTAQHLNELNREVYRRLTMSQEFLPQSAAAVATQYDSRAVSKNVCCIPVRVTRQTSRHLEDSTSNSNRVNRKRSRFSSDVADAVVWVEGSRRASALHG